MYVIGLTGGIGSGKSTVASRFEKLGIEIVDADLLSREVVKPASPALQEITQHFGADILTASGELDRGRLRQIVFANPAERHWLEALLHPLIADLIRQRIAGCDSPYCLLVSPLLLETQQQALVDRVLVVDVSEQTQLKRVRHRDGSDETTIRAIIATQIDRQQRLQAADDVLNNEQSQTDVDAQIAGLHSRYLILANKPANKQ
jgi:dephospho-CoA kinase